MGWLTYLKKWTPHSGRYIREDGELVNVADLMQRKDNIDILLSVEDGQVYQAAWRGQIPVASTIRFYQLINNGGSVRGLAFSGVYLGGPVEYTLCVGSTIGATLETIGGYNADRRLLGSPDFDSVSPIVRVDAASGGTIIDRTFGLTPITGSGRSAGGLSAAGIGGIYDAASSPCFTLQNTSSQIVEVALTWIWKERD